MSKLAPTSKKTNANCLECATLAACFLGKLPHADLLALQPLVQRGTFRRGDILCREAEMASSLKIIKLGTVYGYRLGIDGRERPVGIAGRGAMFGVFSFYGQANLACAVAVSTGRVCEIPVAVLKEMAANNPLLREQVLLAIAHSYGRALAWSEAMRLRGVVNQLAYAMLLLAEAQGNTVVELPSHTALAELLGTTRETITRTLTTLQTEGGVRRLERKKYQIFETQLVARLGDDRFRPRPLA